MRLESSFSFGGRTLTQQEGPADGTGRSAQRALGSHSLLRSRPRGRMEPLLPTVPQPHHMRP